MPTVPGQRFPGTKLAGKPQDSTVAIATAVEKAPRGVANMTPLEHYSRRAEESGSLMPTDRLSERLNCAKLFTGTGISDASQHLMENEPVQSITYASQAKLITSKAAKLQLQMNDFQAIFKEKRRTAEDRFPGENPDWQAWFAELMVWGFYCKQHIQSSHSFLFREPFKVTRLLVKNETFPGKEPARLFPLRSTAAGELTSHKRTDSSVEKWIESVDRGRSSTGTGAGLTMVDSFRSRDSVVRTTTDGGVPLVVDSYRPGAARPIATTLVRPIPSGSSDRSATMNHSSGFRGVQPWTCSVSINDPPANANKHLSLQDSQNRLVSVNNPVGMMSYMPQERSMEKKAIAKGIRREFFQYLQKQRDQVRAEHPDCSPQYRHWVADTRVWAKFCKLKLTSFVLYNC